MKHQISKEPITGQNREIEIKNIHGNIQFQVTLKSGEKVIMTGQLENYTIGSIPIPGNLSQEKAQAIATAQQTLKEKIATAFVKLFDELTA